MSDKPGAATMARKKVYPKKVTGRYRTVRWWISAVLQALLFLGPWIQWNGRQAILFDLPGRRFHLFGLTFWPQETYFVLILLVFLALTLFASTALAGRMWCGYACPQTLFTESFIQVENWIEGDRAKRMRLDKMPWKGEKLLKKGAKWCVWTVMAFWLGVTFVAYFYPGSELLVGIMTGTLSPGLTGVVAFFAGAALFDFGWFREQMCHYVCPYARFQGAMFDRNSLLVAYDYRRGEPRGKASESDKGDCVDCTLCVQVCPMGIDIRKGQQLECITCTACIDACDAVMERLGRPKGLVRYTSLNALEGRPTQVVRPRVVIYGVLLTGLAALFLFLLAGRSPLNFDVVRSVGSNVFGTTADGRLSNVYTVKIVNKEGRTRRVSLSVHGLPGAELVAPQNPIELAPESVYSERVLVLHSGQGLSPATRIEFQAEGDGVHQVRKSTFLAPGGMAR